MSELTIDLDNVETIKDIPTGWYAGVIADTVVGKSKSEEPKPFPSSVSGRKSRSTIRT